MEWNIGMVTPTNLCPVCLSAKISTQYQAKGPFKQSLDHRLWFHGAVFMMCGGGFPLQNKFQMQCVDLYAPYWAWSGSRKAWSSSCCIKVCSLKRGKILYTYIYIWIRSL